MKSLTPIRAIAATCKRYAFANEGAAANHQNGAKSLAEHSFHLAPLIL